MVDFQGVCLQRQLRFEKSSGHHFRGVCASIVIYLFTVNYEINFLL